MCLFRCTRGSWRGGGKKGLLEGAERTVGIVWMGMMIRKEFFVFPCILVMHIAPGLSRVEVSLRAGAVCIMSF